MSLQDRVQKLEETLNNHLTEVAERMTHMESDISWVKKLVLAIFLVLIALAVK